MIIDTFPAFCDYWQRVRSQPLAAQIEAWASQYMSAYPELLAKQIAAYDEDGEDWRAVASEHVFPHLEERFSTMSIARDRLLDIIPQSIRASGARLGIGFPITAVIYVGIGCGAGWATQLSGMPALLFGLENIAETGWHEPATLAGLTAHEIGHLAHGQWRAEAGLAGGSGPWWQLYEEGFAQRIEQVVLGRESWHMVGESYGRDWAKWCAQHLSWLAGEYLRHVAGNLSLRPFFGSWYELQGRRQTGYYLGCRLIQTLEQTFSLREIALLDAGDPRIQQAMLQMAGKIV